MIRLLGALPLVALWAMPLIAALFSIAIAGFDREAWIAMFRHPQLWPGLSLSLWTGTAATLAALMLSLVMAAGFHGTKAWASLQRLSAAQLAIPHLAFAIGFGFLIMPSGILARLASGGPHPPQWVTTQDPGAPCPRAIWRKLSMAKGVPPPASVMGAVQSGFASCCRKSCRRSSGRC
jgi:putative thiamine transport system permease protein